MAITTYTELKTAMADWSARSDLTSYLDDFIDLTETWLKREPQFPESPDIGGIRGDIQHYTHADTAITPGTATLALPTDYADHFRFNFTEETRSVVRYVDPIQLELFHKNGTGKPQWYTITDTIEFNVAPDKAYEYDFAYWPSVAALSGSVADNWVLLNYPDVYLAGCMYHLSHFIQDRDAMDVWIKQYKTSAWTASQTYANSRRSQGSIAIKTDTGNP